MKLTATQQKVYDKIVNAPASTPDKSYNEPFYLKEYWEKASIVVPGYVSKWDGGFVYGTFNTATLRALEKAGLIKIHKVGGAVMPDKIEVLVKQ